MGTAILPSMQMMFDLGQALRVSSGGDLITQCYELRGNLNVDRLYDALQRVSDAHDALRLRFSADGDGIVRMAAHSSSPVAIEFLRPVGWVEEQLPKLAPALGAKAAASTWGEESIRWALLQLQSSRHLLATWHFRPTVDARSITRLHAEVWNAYFDPSCRLPDASFLEAVSVRRVPQRAPAEEYWASERARIQGPSWSPSDVSVSARLVETVDGNRELALRSAAAKHRISVSQLLAHRLATVGLATSEDGSIVLHCFVDERGPKDTEVVGNFSSIVPVVLDANDVSSARKTAAKLLQAFSKRPTSAGSRPPWPYVELAHRTRGFGYNYLPANFLEDVQPDRELTVREMPNAALPRHPNHFMLSVVERIDGGLDCTLTYHPSEHDELQAQAILTSIIDT